MQIKCIFFLNWKLNICYDFLKVFHKNIYDNEFLLFKTSLESIIEI